MCFWHCLHLCGLMYFHLHLYRWLYFYFNNIIFPYVHLRCSCFHKVLFHSLVFVQFFNEHWIYWCSSWSCLLSCTLTSSVFVQKFNYRCSNSIYIMNYHLHKLHLLIIRFSFCTFQRWWWMWRRPLSQWLNIQHAFSLCSSELLFNFYSFQQFCFFLLPSFALTPLHFLFLYYSL